MVDLQPDLVVLEKNDGSVILSSAEEAWVFISPYFPYFEYKLALLSHFVHEKMILEETWFGIVYIVDACWYAIYLS